MVLLINNSLIAMWISNYFWICLNCFLSTKIILLPWNQGKTSVGFSTAETWGHHNTSQSVSLNLSQETQKFQTEDTHIPLLMSLFKDNHSSISERDLNKDAPVFASRSLGTSICEVFTLKLIILQPSPIAIASDWFCCFLEHMLLPV